MKNLLGKWWVSACMLLAVVSAPWSATSCVDNEPDEAGYYTFTGEMASDYLAHREESFSDFIEVLKRAEMWDLMGTYGHYTCFAPTNAAMKEYLAGRQVADLPKAMCDTLAWTHIVKATYFISDNAQASMTNMNDRKLNFKCDTTMVDGEPFVHYYVNDNSELIVRDDSVENGVVHVIDHLIGNNSEFLPDVMAKDEGIKLFTEALFACGLDKLMMVYEDDSYRIDPDSAVIYPGTSHHTTFGNNDVYWKFPKTRKYMYTVFAEPDSIYEQAGITNLHELFDYAKSIYDDTYPEDAGKYDDDYTNRKNPLNRFIAYHMLDRYADYDEITVSTSGGMNARQWFRTELQDIMEFYETMCPYTIMKVSDAANEKWLNRKGLGRNYQVRGSKIMRPEYDTKAINGVYYFIDEILTYNRPITIDRVLNCRMRIDATTLSPDFMNADARNNKPSEDNVSFRMIGFKNGFCKNFQFGDNTFFGVHNRFWCLSYEDDMCACLGSFDIKFRLPPVPADQTYEIRLGYVAGNNRTVVQVYLEDIDANTGVSTGNIPCGIPVDLRVYARDYGWLHDTDDLNDDSDAIEANDKALRNQGYMKSMDSFTTPAAETHRNLSNDLRRILVNKYFEKEHDYYIRLRQVLDNQAEMSLDYIEIVPKSIYDGPVAEDRH